MGNVGVENSEMWQRKADDTWMQELSAVTGLPCSLGSLSCHG